MPFAVEWDPASKNKRMTVGFVIPDVHTMSVLNDHISIKYSRQGHGVMGVARSNKPLRYNAWKRCLENATLYLDTDFDVSDKENVNVRQYFDAVLVKYRSR